MTEYERIARRIASRPEIPDRETSARRFRAALAELNLKFPENGRGVALVAGTNGKGSVAKTLETLLAAAGRATGLFTSPHLQKTTERIRSHGADLSEGEFVAAFRAVEGLVGKFGLSHFETLTLMMALAFFTDRVRPPVEFAVLEVGVGGRLDPTNAIPHELAVLARLGLDHQSVLGATLAEIAREKLGIVSGARAVAHAPVPPEATAAFLDARARNPDIAWREPEGFRLETRSGGLVPEYRLHTPWGPTALALMGPRGAENTALALTAFEALGFAPAAGLAALPRVRWPGRMERFRLLEHPAAVFLSGDHNPQGAASLAELLRDFRYETARLVVGIGAAKDSRAMLDVFAAIPRSRLYLTRTPFKGGPLADYGEHLARAVKGDEDPVQAIRAALADAGPNDLVVVTGSLYLVGDARQALLDGRFGTLAES